jgi:hypothetical protein
MSIHGIRSLLLCIAASALSAVAAPILPVSYTATPGEGQAQGGSLNYFDDTGAQLTDGVLGANNWNANDAYEWVGWKVAEPSLNFNFAGTVAVNEVRIGFNRNDGSGIYLPSSIQIGGDVFAIAANGIADNSRGFLTFTGDWSGSSLSIALSDGDAGRWIFVDEVKFDGDMAAAVPEPATGMLFLSAGLLTLVGTWKRRSASAKPSVQ